MDNKNLKEEIENVILNIIENGSEYYNSPFYFQPNSGEEVIANTKEHNKNRTSFDKPTKKSVQSALKYGLNQGADWYKVPPLGTNKNISKANNREILHENKLIVEDDNDNQNNNDNNNQDQQTDNQNNNQDNQQNNTNNNEQNDPLDFLYSISRKDVILLYNSIFAPLFAFWKHKFSLTDKGKRLPIFDLYIQCDLHLSKLNSKNEEDAKNLYKYTKLKAANDSLIPSIKNLFEGLDTKLIQDDKTEIDAIKTKIQNGIESISKALGQILIPISNGYIQTLDGLNNPGLKSLAEGAKQSDLVNKTIKIIQDEQKRFILSRFKSVIEKSSGTWLVSRIQASMNNLNAHIQINVDGKKTDTQFNLLTDNNEVNSFIEEFKKPFTESINTIDEYNKKFHDFVSNIDISKLKNIMTRIDSTNVIKKYLRTQGAGMFDKITDNVAKEISEKLKSYTHTKEEDKKKSDEEQEKASLNTTKGYLLKTLGFDKDNLKDEELDYAEIITRNYTDFNIRENKLEFKGLGNYTQPEQLHEIILNTIRGKGNLLEFTQNWFVIAHKNELILWSAGKMDIDNILRHYSKENGNDEDENSDLTKKQIPSLTESLGKTQMNAYSNGHDLNWQANRATVISLKYLSHYGYVQDLAKLPESFWNFMFDDNFKKNKLFTDSQINNPEDIQKAEKKLGGEESIKSKNPFVDYLNKFVDIMRSLDSNAQNNLKVSNFKQLVNKYSNNLKQLNENQINEIGNITSNFLIKFLDKYGRELKPQNNSLADHKTQAKFLSEKLLNVYFGKDLKREQIDELTKGIEGLLDNPQNGIKYKNSLGDILKCLNKSFNNNNNRNSFENNNNDFNSNNDFDDNNSNNDYLGNDNENNF